MDFSPLSTAGSGLRDISKTALNRVAASPITGSVVNGANRVVTAARGLRMPGVGAPVAVTPSAVPVSSVPEIPTLTDVIKPGTGYVKPPDIPTLTDVLTPGEAPAASARITGANPNVPVGGMSAEAAAAGYGSATVPKPPGYVPPAAAPAEVAPMARGMRSMGSAANMLGKVVAVPGAAIAGYDAAQDMRRGDTAGAALHGGDALASAALLTPAAPVAGAYLGGRLAGDGVSAMLSDKTKSTLGGVGNQALQNVGDIVGQHWGYDDRPALLANAMADRAVNGVPAGPAAKTAAASTTVPAAGTSDIDAFNARMVKVGAPTVGMRAGEDGPASRELFNSAPASADAVKATEQNMGMRSAQMAAATADNARLAERAAADQKMAQITDQRFSDSPEAHRLDAAAAPRQPFATQPQQDPRIVAADRAAAQKDFETSKQLRAGGVVSMRGQDTTSDDARLQQQTAQMQGMRAQANSNFEHQLQLMKNGQEQDKVSMEQRSKGEADLTNRLNTMFVGPDGKPDAARVGDATQKMQAEIGRRIQQAQAVPKDSPHYAEAQQIAGELSKKGVAALDPADHKVLLSQLALRDRMKQQHGVFTPGGANFVDSDLGDYRVDGVEKNLIGSPTLHMANGGSMRQADTMYTDPASAFYNGMKVPTDMFDAGLGMRTKGKK